VRFLSGAGIRQYLDIGSGIPTQGNVHEVAQAADPGARVVYADIDPVAIAHSQALLARNPAAEVLHADLRDPRRILDDDVTRRLIDFRQPAGLLLVSVLPFVGPGEDPWGLVAALRDALAPGSYLVVSHGTDEGRPSMAEAAATVYNRSVSANLHMRSRADILRFFDGFDLVDPGLTWAPAWRPDGTPTGFADPAQSWMLAGVGVRP
jgi:SAM-dependent methyltransferase